MVFAIDDPMSAPWERGLGSSRVIYAEDTGRGRLGGGHRAVRIGDDDCDSMSETSILLNRINNVTRNSAAPHVASLDDAKAALRAEYEAWNSRAG